MHFSTHALFEGKAIFNPANCTFFPFLEAINGATKTGFVCVNMSAASGGHERREAKEDALHTRSLSNWKARLSRILPTEPANARFSASHAVQPAARVGSLDASTATCRRRRR